VQAVLDKGNRKVGLLGMEEPIVEVAQRLIGKGFDLRVYDCARSQHLTHLRVGSIDELLSHAQTIVIGRAASEFADVVQRIRDGQTIIDLARACDSRTIVGVYEGLCW
jgi:GDP-mannose 6-dehydrogenase